MPINCYVYEMGKKTPAGNQRIIKREQGTMIINPEKFDEKDLRLIKDVHFDRDNDDYLKGLEYLSSLFILAECNGLAAGNCGGTEVAVFLNLGKYEDKMIFDLWEY